MDVPKNYYAILQVEMTATAQEIRKAYIELIKLYHPDVHQGDNTAEEKAKELNEAYEILKDEARRAEYDLDYNAAFGKPAYRPPSAYGTYYVWEDQYERLDSRPFTGYKDATLGPYVVADGLYVIHYAVISAAADTHFSPFFGIKFEREDEGEKLDRIAFWSADKGTEPGKLYTFHKSKRIPKGIYRVEVMATNLKKWTFKLETT